MHQAFAKLAGGMNDPLLEQMALFHRDERPKKLDLGVGVFRNDAGETPVMAAVRAAEKVLAETGMTKVYEGPQGNRSFCSAIIDLVYGDRHPLRQNGRCLGLATVGGAGALHRAMAFSAQGLGCKTVWVSSTTWPNHEAIAEGLGIEVKRYGYAAGSARTVIEDPIVDSLDRAKPGDLIVLQGPCHNPTGCDLAETAWRILGEYVSKRRLLPLLDIAYHGFGGDLIGLRAFLESVPEALVAYSCSKNFGLYRERTGALIVQAATSDRAEAAVSAITAGAWSEYFMPPAHGPAIVDQILSNQSLRSLWSAELATMSEKLVNRRTIFTDTLVAATGNVTLSRLKWERGMFSMLRLDSEALMDLRDEHAIYVPTSGRINFGALPARRAADVACLLATTLSD